MNLICAYVYVTLIDRFQLIIYYSIDLRISIHFLMLFSNTETTMMVISKYKLDTH